MHVTLVAINAKHFHKSLAPWCLKARMEEQVFDANVKIIETDINTHVDEILHEILCTMPDIVGFSCYIWNIDHVVRLGNLLKKLRPDIKIILGGPEVSFEEHAKRYPFCDCIVRGVGEDAFCDVVWHIQNNVSHDGEIPPFIDGCFKDFKNFPSPFTQAYFNSLANDKIPVGKKLIYYESVRGCPFSCAYCLSSATQGVEYLPITRVKKELHLLLTFGVQTIKFVDRTFNADKKRCAQILEFVRELDTTCVFHFEVAADLFDDTLFSIIESMPIGRVQFEIGVQSINESVLTAVNRKTDTNIVLANTKKLVSFGNCHIHIGLIAGLPSETLEMFKKGIDACCAIGAQCVQLGFLKMLKGANILKMQFGAIFAPYAPYEVFQTNTISFYEMARLKKVEHVIDRFYNSGGYFETIHFFANKIFGSYFDFFEKFTEYLLQHTSSFNVSLKNAYALLHHFLLENGASAIELAHYIKLDCFSYDRNGLSMPDIICTMRDKVKENAFSNDIQKGIQYRVEQFPLDNTYRLFVYDKKNPINNRYNNRIV